MQMYCSHFFYNMENSSKIYSFEGVVKMSKYLPIEIKPSLSNLETYNGGLNNQNFINYRNLFDDSPTHNSIVKAFVNFGVGDGLVIENSNEISRYVDDADVKNAFQDLKINGCFAFLVYWKDGKPFRLSYIDVEKISIKVKRGTIDHESYVYCLDFQNQFLYKKKYYKKFTGTYNGNQIELLYVRNNNKFIFGVPDYTPAIQWATIEAELANLGKNHVQNALSPTNVINVNSGQIDDKIEREEQANELRNRFTGSDGATTIVSFNPDANYAMTVDRLLPPDLNQQNVFYTEEAERCIIKGHSAHPILFSGAQTATGFSNNADERLQSMQEMYRKNINPLRNDFISGIIPIFALIDTRIKLHFLDFDKVKEL